MLFEARCYFASTHCNKSSSYCFLPSSPVSLKSRVRSYRAQVSLKPYWSYWYWWLFELSLFNGMNFFSQLSHEFICEIFFPQNFNDETRDIRASTRRLLREIHEPVARAQSLPRYGRASSVQPTYSRWEWLAEFLHFIAHLIYTLLYCNTFLSKNRFDPDLIDKYGNSLIENEFYVNKNILRPTRKTRDHIEILSNIKYREPSKRYSGKLTWWKRNYTHT